MNAILKDSQNLIVRTLWAEEVKVVAAYSGAFELP